MQVFKIKGFVCKRFLPTFPSPPPTFIFWPKPRIPFLGLSLLRNQTETLATQASRQKDSFISNTSEGGQRGRGAGCLKKKDGLFEKRDRAAEGQKHRNFQLVNKSSGISPHKVLQWRLINAVYHLWVTNNKGERGLKERAVINFLPLKREGGLLERGVLNRGFTVYMLIFLCQWHQINSAPCHLVNTP